jgi:hypothetical protein
MLANFGVRTLGYHVLDGDGALGLPGETKRPGRECAGKRKPDPGKPHWNDNVADPDLPSVEEPQQVQQRDEAENDAGDPEIGRCSHHRPPETF